MSYLHAEIIENIVLTAQNLADSRMHECKRTHKGSRRFSETGTISQG